MAVFHQKYYSEEVILYRISGLSKEEFSRFLDRVPSHLREQFESAQFQSFDENNDNVINSEEFGKMLDQVMQNTKMGAKK